MWASAQIWCHPHWLIASNNHQPIRVDWVRLKWQFCWFQFQIHKSNHPGQIFSAFNRALAKVLQFFESHPQGLQIKVGEGIGGERSGKILKASGKLWNITHLYNSWIYQSTLFKWCCVFTEFCYQWIQWVSNTASASLCAASWAICRTTPAAACWNWGSVSSAPCEAPKTTRKFGGAWRMKKRSGMKWDINIDTWDYGILWDLFILWDWYEYCGIIIPLERTLDRFETHPAVVTWNGCEKSGQPEVMKSE